MSGGNVLLKLFVPRGGVEPGERWNEKGGSSISFDGQSFNPERIGSFSPGLARLREGLPWVATFKFINAEGVE